MTDLSPGQPEFDTGVPHSARIWNYWLGGTDNYPVDREAGDQYRQAYPQIVELARASRAFQRRVVGYLTDLHDPAEILAVAGRMLDFSEPVALLLMGVMGHLDDETAYLVVGQLLGGLAPGSYFGLQDGAQDSEEFNQAQQDYDDTGAIPYRLRTPARIAAFFDGLDLVAPGVVPVTQWRPDPAEGTPRALDSYGGVARKAAR